VLSKGMLEAKMAEMIGAKTIDELMAEHRALDAQVEALSRRQYLTQAEQLEHAILKKKRLRARDQLAELSRAVMRT
jgi:hypothetical protein